MKKNIFFASALAMAAVAGLASCNGKCDKSCKADMPDQTYTGLLPAADCPGIRYTLKLDYDDDAKGMKGDYNLVETYLDNDSTSVSGVKDSPSFTSEGDFKVEERGGKKYMTLYKDAKDSHNSAVSNLYFEVASDSTLTMVNENFQPVASDSLNYTLKLAK